MTSRRRASGVGRQPCCLDILPRGLSGVDIFSLLPLGSSGHPKPQTTPDLRRSLVRRILVAVFKLHLVFLENIAEPRERRKKKRKEKLDSLKVRSYFYFLVRSALGSSRRREPSDPTPRRRRSPKIRRMSSASISGVIRNGSDKLLSH